MRVAHVIAGYRDGMGYEENHLPFVQASQGLDVEIITSALLQGPWHQMPVDGRISEFETVGRSEDRGVGIRRLHSGFRARKNSQIVLKGLRRELKAIQPDVIHIHGPVGALSVQSAVAANVLNIPAVVDNHVCYFNLRPYGLIKRAYYRMFRNFLIPLLAANVVKYLPLMPDSEAVLHNELGIDHDRIVHSSLGVDTGLFGYDESARRSIRESLGIPADSQVIAFVGRITPEKDADVLVSTWNSMAADLDVHLMLIGPATEEMVQRLVALVNPALRSMLTITGHVPNAQLPAYMSASDIGVWPGDPGISIMQAMACGMVIVCTELGYIAGVPSGGNGRLFRRRDVKGLTLTLRELLNDRNSLEVMRAAAVDLTQKVLDWQVVASRTNRIYEEALSGRSQNIPPLWESPYKVPP